jgi:hypothetical protein
VLRGQTYAPDLAGVDHAPESAGEKAEPFATLPITIILKNYTKQDRAARADLLANLPF